MLLCPACDHILNAAGCQGCGWKTGDKWPAHRLMQGSAHPLKARDLYPPATGTVNVAVVAEPEPVKDQITSRVVGNGYENAELAARMLRKENGFIQ